MMLPEWQADLEDFSYGNFFIWVFLHYSHWFFLVFWYSLKTLEEIGIGFMERDDADLLHKDAKKKKTVLNL
jgi:hypothetical protein